MTVGLIAPDDDAKKIKDCTRAALSKKLTSGLSDANIAYDVTYAFVGLDNVKKTTFKPVFHTPNFLPSKPTGKLRLSRRKKHHGRDGIRREKNIRRAVIEQKN
ncbi:MAG: hypothetical protein L6V85_09855 [Clostridiales bacterium]|nr:MAG: hypothetical protein L6V85_09855 [Clostridiales bacterium]